MQDKVDVSGTTFTACFTVMYACLFLMNIFLADDHLDPLSFWIQGMFYYIYLLFCLASYRDKRELCFYCKYEMVQGGLHCVLGFFMTKAYQWAFIVVVLFIFACVVIVRQAAKEDREEERIKKLSQEKYAEANKRERSAVSEEDAPTVAYKQAPTEENVAYLTPKQAETPKARPPPKAQKQRNDELLVDIPEEEQSKEEEIEVIECPGIDGARQH